MKILVRRGPHVESTHQASYIVMDNHGQVLESQGDLTEKIFPRSAIKMIQILPLQRFKKLQGLETSEQELACGCASHAGEKCHVDVVAAWLQRLSLSSENLICGAHLPFDEQSAKLLLRSGQAPSKMHNNCSGKHAGMLEWAQLLGAPVDSYGDISHPVQKMVRAEMENLSEYKMADGDWGIDGCGIPAWRLPLKNLGMMLSRFSQAAATPGTVEEKIFQACVKHPVLTAGSQEYCALAMQRVPREIFLKVGAEGLMTAILPNQNKVIAVKIHDGAERAAEVAMSTLLVRTFPEMSAALSAWTAPTLYNWAGTAIGTIEVT